MCGIFGILSPCYIKKNELKTLAHFSKQRGKDSSGLLVNTDKGYRIIRADYNIDSLIKNESSLRSNFVFGHSRLITNGLSDNQPVVRSK